MARPPRRSDLGSTRPKPAVPPSAPQQHLDVFANPNPERDYLIQFVVPEFTCNCPLTGQPDFAHFTIEMVADKLCIELKSLKLYFWSYRNVGAFHEEVTNTILDDIVAATKPRFVRISGALERARRHLHQRRRRASQEGLEAGTRGRAAVSDESGHALVMWAKVPGATGAQVARGRPAPYNAGGRYTRGDAAAQDVAFDLTLLRS